MLDSWRFFLRRNVLQYFFSEIFLKGRNSASLNPLFVAKNSLIFFSRLYNEISAIPLFMRN